MGGKLVAIDGPLKGQVFSTDSGSLSIGRAPANCLAIAGDAFVSREHCVLRTVDGQFVLEDLDSQNGTFVNGVPVRSRVLAHGDYVQAGNSVFLFLLRDASHGGWPGAEAEGETPLFGVRLVQPEGAVAATKTLAVREAPRRTIQHDLIGESQAMERVYAFIGKVAAADATVLILGESGTGKELVARAIHKNSARARGPFVAINCAALTEALLESELFGHERGAFTGAVSQKIGRMERAEGGTFFLDEVGELRAEAQAKLLRVVQERSFERLGGTRSLPLNIRIIAATNRDLHRGVERSEFRADLYYRLNALAVRMPALRERREDIPLLACHFVAKCREKLGRRIAGISRSARALLMSYDWPGNVRELENAIEHAAVLGSGERILPEDLPERILDYGQVAAGGMAPYHLAVKEAKRQLILRAFSEAAGDPAEAARRLGLQRTYLHRLVRNLDLRDAVRALRETRSEQSA
jgi:DNA-binding NtrC family response regulator